MVVVLPPASVSLTGLPHAGSSTLTVVCDVEVSPAVAGGLITSVFVVRPWVSVYFVVVVLFAASVTATGRPYASYLVRATARGVTVVAVACFAFSTRVASPR